MELINELFSEANFFPTALMILVLLYWSLMIFGVVGLDMFDIDVDLDLGLDADFDINADIDLEGNTAAAGSTQVGGGSTATGNDSALKALFDFFYLSDIPIVMVGSSFVFGYWASSLLTNHYFNPEQTFLGSLILVIPNLIVALIFMRLSMMPLVSSFRKSAPEDLSRQDMIGVVGRVTTSEVTEKYGQLEVIPPGEPELLLNVRCKPGAKIAKGDAAKILSYNQHNGTFLVELTKWENTSDE